MCRNPAYTKLTSTKHINDPASCPAHASKRLLGNGPTSDEFEPFEFLVMAGAWVLVSVVTSTILGIILLRVFQHRAALMVKVAMIIQTAFLLVAGVALCAAGAIDPLAIVPGAVMLGAFVMATVACVRMWHNPLPLVARLISVAAKGLDVSHPPCFLTRHGPQVACSVMPSVTAVSSACVEFVVAAKFLDTPTGDCCLVFVCAQPSISCLRLLQQ
jgi:hypothetical protein